MNRNGRREKESDTATKQNSSNSSKLVEEVMQVSMFRRRGVGGGTGKGAAFEHFCFHFSGEFDHKFCPMLRTFEFDRAENWVLNSRSRRRHLGNIGMCEVGLY